MSDFRKGDVVTMHATVSYTRDAYVDLECSDGRSRTIAANALTLVERPGPRLEDLPDGTVIKTAKSVPLIVGDNRLIGSMMGSTVKFHEWDPAPFEVIGACPGTPAWDLWATAFYNQTHYHPEVDGEWWRSE